MITCGDGGQRSCIIVVGRVMPRIPRFVRRVRTRIRSLVRMWVLANTVSKCFLTRKACAVCHAHSDFLLPRIRPCPIRHIFGIFVSFACIIRRSERAEDFIFFDYIWASSYFWVYLWISLGLSLASLVYLVYCSFQVTIKLVSGFR